MSTNGSSGVVNIRGGFVEIGGRLRKISVNGAGYQVIHNIGGRKGKNKYIHVLKAEMALGRELPPGADVHHVDGNKANNENSNLVVCPSRAYHMMLHRRQRAYEATGDASAVRCEYCGKHGADKERAGRPNVGWHYECKRAYNNALYARRNGNV